MAVKVPESSSRYWDFSQEGVEEISKLRKRLLHFCERMEKAGLDLMGAIVEYGEDLGPYKDNLENGIAEIERTNKISCENIVLLERRIAAYEKAVRDELGLFSFDNLLSAIDEAAKN